MIGAEIFIEPGQTRAEIDGWFRTLKESGMPLTRIRMFERYMKDSAGNWDFQLFDWAFESGERHGIKIYGNLFPDTPFDDVGGFKFPRTDQHLAEIADYIERTVTHFRRYRSLYGWVPVNEPGVGGKLDQHPFTERRFSEWKATHQPATYDANGFEHFDFAQEKFLLHHNSWFLGWLTNEIHRHDPGRPVHVNNHDLFRNVAEYDFPAWREFLTSLGGSAHASWHFGYFKPSQYALAVDANSEIIRSGAGTIPWLMTELQGGNNTYSGYDPLCPTPEEIAQWLWVTTAGESKGSIFWCLNPRLSGIEAGEWALLDFQDRPTDRMRSASAVAKAIDDHGDFFAKARVLESGVNLLYIRESMWVEKKLLNGIQDDHNVARQPGAGMKSLLAYHEALMQGGMQSNIQEIGEFDFSKANYKGSVVILPHQIAIPGRYRQSIKDFVNKGGQLIVDGLTGFYDENAITVMRDFPFADVFGGEIKEFRFRKESFRYGMHQQADSLDATGWMGLILPGPAAQTIASEGDGILGVKTAFGTGEVIWIPTLLGLGARIADDLKPLGLFLENTVKIPETSVRFAGHHPGMLLKTMQNGNDLGTVLVNKGTSVTQVRLEGLDKERKGKVIFKNKGGKVDGSWISVDPEETIVVLWQ